MGLALLADKCRRKGRRVGPDLAMCGRCRVGRHGGQAGRNSWPPCRPRPGAHPLAMHAAPPHAGAATQSFEGGFMRELGWSPTTPRAWPPSWKSAHPSSPEINIMSKPFHTGRRRRRRHRRHGCRHRPGCGRRRPHGQIARQPPRCRRQAAIAGIRAQFDKMAAKGKMSTEAKAGRWRTPACRSSNWPTWPTPPWWSKPLSKAWTPSRRCTAISKPSSARLHFRHQHLVDFGDRHRRALKHPERLAGLHFFQPGTA
jgi:hypothetical protein